MTSIPLSLHDLPPNPLHQMAGITTLWVQFIEQISSSGDHQDSQGSEPTSHSSPTLFPTAQVTCRHCWSSARAGEQHSTCTGIYKGRIFPPKENWQKQNNPQQTETDLYVGKSNIVSLSHLHNIYIFIAGKSLTTVEDPCLNSPLPRH